MLCLGLYKHYKGGTYRLIGIGKHTEREELLCFYQSLNTGELWARPFLNFIEKVDHAGEKIPRFTFIKE